MRELIQILAFSLEAFSWKQILGKGQNGDYKLLIEHTDSICHGIGIHDKIYMYVVVQKTFYMK